MVDKLDALMWVAGCVVIVALALTGKSCTMHRREEGTKRIVACKTDRCRCMAYTNGDSAAVLGCR